MTSSPLPLAKVTVELPDWPVVDRWRRHVDAARSASGYVATAAGFLAAAAGLFTPLFAGVALGATAVLTFLGLLTLRFWRPEGHQRATATVLYLAPGVGLAVLLIVEQLVPGPHWVEALLLMVWTTVVPFLRPARTARLMMCPPPPPPPAPKPAPSAEVACDHPAARWWAANVAVDSGAGPGTLLENIEQIGEASIRATIRSAAAGQPVPDISIRRLSALMDVPEELIGIGPVPGRGAGVRCLTIGTAAAAAADPATVWAQRIAPAAMPGTVLTGVRTGRLGVPGGEGGA
ncbi:hypothetical protein ACFFMN_34080 [Planobispora siamensis]|uniref:Uncharacterized protein n=1 Tax=Planobispora siamensis TaxID=936338 RepID=A0A8J3SFF8_9ACTN|nr:hypothetical protein [Planobispora siamensis]GIH91917.1 hypothetical protein Psi01_25470 [Planobispora siamensis]